MESLSPRRPEDAQARERVLSVPIPKLVRDPSVRSKQGHVSSSNRKQSKSKGNHKMGKYFNHPQVVRPKRPRSAYNLFFKDQRNQMLEEAGEDLSMDEDEEINRFKVAIKEMPKSSKIESEVPPEASKRKRGRPRGPNYKPRKPCKRRGAFSFSQLAKLIGPKWKNLDEASKIIYNKRAAVDLRKYREAMKIYNSIVERLEKESRKTGPPSTTYSAPSITPNSSVSRRVLPSTNESPSSRSSASSSARASIISFSNSDKNPVNQDRTASKNDKIDKSGPLCVSSGAFESSNPSSTSPSGRASPTSSTSSISEEILDHARGLMNLSTANSNVCDGTNGDSLSKTDKSTDGKRREPVIEAFKAKSFISKGKKKELCLAGCSAPSRQGDIVQLRTSAQASARVMASRNVAQKSGGSPLSDKHLSSETQSSSTSEPKSNKVGPSGGKFRWEDHYNIPRKTNLHNKSISQDTGLQQTRGVVPTARFLIQHNPFMSSSSNEASDDVCDGSNMGSSLSSDKSRGKTDSGTSKNNYTGTHFPANVYTSSSSDEINRDDPNRSSSDYHTKRRKISLNEALQTGTTSFLLNKRSP